MSEKTMGKEILPPGVSSVVATPPPTREKPPETTADRYGKWRKETEQREASCPHGLKRLATAILGNWLGRIGLGLGVATVVGVAYEAVPAIHSTVDSLTGQGELVVPDTFDPTAKEGVIGANNSIIVTPEQYEQMQKEETAPPTIDAEKDAFNLPLAIKFKNGTIRPFEYEFDRASITYKNVPQGAVIIAVADGEIAMDYYNEIRNGEKRTGGLTMKPPKETKPFTGIIYSFLPAEIEVKPLIDAPMIENDPNKRTYLLIKAGTELGEVVRGGQFSIVGYAGTGHIGIASSSSQKAIVIQ